MPASSEEDLAVESADATDAPEVQADEAVVAESSEAANEGAEGEAGEAADDTSEVSGYAGGSGTAEDPYQIATADQLRYFSDQVKEGNDLTASVVLTASINLNGDAGNQWQPIGSSTTHAYAGTFDGQGYTIAGLYIDNDNADKNNAGLFGYVNVGVAVKNLVLKGEINTTSASSGYAGSVIALGSPSGNGQFTLESIVSYVSIAGAGYAGGLYGYDNNNNAYATIRNCVNFGSVKSSRGAGGIVGSSAGINISDCINYGEITGSAAGIANVRGGMAGLKFANCINAGLLASGSDAIYSHNELYTPNTPNCYYVTGTMSGTTTQAMAISESELQSASFWHEKGLSFELGAENKAMPSAAVFGKASISNLSKNFKSMPGEDFTLSVDARTPNGFGSDGTLSYQWFVSQDQQNWTVLGEGSSLTTKAPTDEGSYFYRCVVTNEVQNAGETVALTTTSNTVQGVVSSVYTNIEIAPLEDQAVQYGYSAHLESHATVEGGTAVYQWYRVDGGESTAIEGAASSDYYAAPFETAEYYVEVSLVLDGTVVESKRSNTVRVSSEGKMPAAGTTMEIGSYDDMLAFANLANHWKQETGESYIHLNAVLTGDIDLGGEEHPWISIAASTSTGGWYAGVFDGNFHTISGLYTERSSKSSGGGALFGGCSGAEIKNFVLQGHVENNEDRMGAVAGMANSGTVFSRIRNEATVVSKSTNYSISGIAYAQDKTVVFDQCANYGTIESSRNAFGICEGQGTVTNSYNAGKLITTNDGTLAGIGESAQVSNSVNYGSYQSSAGAFARAYGVTASGSASNSYYAPTAGRMDVSAESVSNADLTTIAFAQKLGLAFDQGEGGPILRWEKEETPVISADSEDQSIDINAEAVLSVQASLPTGGSMSYQWYRADSPDLAAAQPVEGADKADYAFATGDQEKVAYYVCLVTNEATGSASLSRWVSVSVANQGLSPVFTVEPEGIEGLALNNWQGKLSASAFVKSGSVQYQWYECDDDGSNARKIDGDIDDADGSSYYRVPRQTTVGDHFYYVEATRMNGAIQGATVRSDVVRVSVVDYATLGEEMLPEPLFTMNLADSIFQGSTSTLARIRCTHLNGVQYPAKVTYTVQYKDSLLDPIWLPGKTASLDPMFQNTYVDVSWNLLEFKGSHRYFRVEASYTAETEDGPKTVRSYSPTVHVSNLDPDFNPAIAEGPLSAEYQASAGEAAPLTVNYDKSLAVFKKQFGIDATGIKVNWYRNATGSTDVDESELVGTGDSYVPSIAQVGRWYYFCTASYEYAWAGKGYDISGTSIVPVQGAQEYAYTSGAVSAAAAVTVVDSEEAAQPEVHLTDTSDRVIDQATDTGAQPVSATVSFDGAGVGDVSYAWYASLNPDGEPSEEDVLVSSGIADDVTVTSAFDDSLVGDYYYYCVITNTFQHIKIKESVSERVKVSCRAFMTITTADDMYDFQEAVNSGETFKGKTIYLANDINLTDNVEATDWTPMGNGQNATNPFSGTFDGGGHTISGLAINAPQTSFRGLFGYVKGAVIKNVVVQGEIFAYGTSAGLVARADGVEFYHVGNEVNLTVGYTQCAGLVADAGYSAAGLVIEDSYNAGDIIGVPVNGRKYSRQNAGLVYRARPVASVDDRIVRSYNSGTVTTSGYDQNSAFIYEAASGTGTIRIEDCFNAGEISGPSGALYELVFTGDAYTTLVNCYNVVPEDAGNIEIEPAVNRVTAEQIADPSFVDTLNGPLVTPAFKMGTSHPLVVWQTDNLSKRAPKVSAQSTERSYEWMVGQEIEEGLRVSILLSDFDQDDSVSYQWYRSPVPGTSDEDEKVEGASGLFDHASTQVVTEMDPDLSQPGTSYYYCVATSIESKDAARSPLFKVSVCDSAEVSITQQPANQQTELGTSASLSVAASVLGGDAANLTFQWFQVSAEGATAIEGATDAELVVPADELGEFAYYCVVSSPSAVTEAVYQAQSQTATVTVNPAKETEVYISSADDLAAWRTELGTGNFADMTLYLTRDIDMTSNEVTKNWAQITSFYGVLDGQGHTIKGGFSSGTTVGFTKNLYGTVKNVLVDGETALSSTSVTTMGPICGSVRSGGLIQNVGSSVDLTLEATSRLFYRIGGIAGYVYSGGAIENSFYDGVLQAVGAQEASQIGGIAGINLGAIHDSYNAGMISASSPNTYEISGIASMYTGAGEIDHCFNYGSVIMNEGEPGEAIASSTFGTVTDCYYLEGSGNDARGTSVAKTADEMADPTFAVELGESFQAGIDYPLLAWQVAAPSVMVQVVDSAWYVQGASALPEDASPSNDGCAPLQFKVKELSGGSTTYQWYRQVGNESEAVAGATDSVFQPSTAERGTFAYYCVATFTRGGSSWSAVSNISQVEVVSSTPASAPIITAQPLSPEQPIPAESVGPELTVRVSGDGMGLGQLTYQWYRMMGSEPNPAEDFLLDGETSSVYRADTSRDLTGAESYYYCVVTNLFENKVAVTVSELASVTISKQVIEVASVSDLYELVCEPAWNSQETFKGVIINLTADEYDLSSDPRTKTWYPIGTSQAPFAGEFYGNGAVISNLVTAPTAANANTSSGFFGYAVGSSEDEVVIEGLTLSGSLTVTADSRHMYHGGLVGYAKYAHISDIQSSVTRTASQGGPTYSTISLAGWHGGIAGYAEACVVERCSNTAPIQQGPPVGGIVGEAVGSTLSECWNAGNLTAALAGSVECVAGGISGTSDSTTTIENCYNLGTVTYYQATRNTSVTPSVSGITGGTAGKIAHCYNAGEVKQIAWYASNLVAPIGSGDVVNCYYLQAKCIPTVSDGSIALGENDLTQAAERLNGGAETTVWFERASGYPQLWWERPVDIEHAWTVSVVDSLEWTGSALCPAVTVTDQNGETVNPTSYEVTYSDNVDRGTATVTVKVKRPGFTGTASATFEIVSHVLAESEVAAQTSFVYNGVVQKPIPVVTVGNEALVEGVDYVVTMPVAVNAGSYVATVTGLGNYGGTVEVPFTIAKAPLTIAAASAVKEFGASDPAFSYTAGALADPSARILSVSLARAAGEAADGTYAIMPANAVIASNGMVVTDNYAITYVPGTLTIGPDRNPSMGGATSPDNTGSGSGSNPGAAGSGPNAGSGSSSGTAGGTTVIVAPTPAPTKTPTLKFASSTISKTIGDAAFDASLAKERTDGDVTYTSSNPKVAKVNATTGKVTLVGVGSAVITATAKAGTVYKAGTAKVTIKVAKPARVTIAKVTGAKKALTVKYKKVKNVSGYEVQFSTAKSFKKNLKKASVSKSKVTKKVTKLKTKTKYYVRVRAYVKVNGKKIYGSWSKVATAKTK